METLSLATASIKHYPGSCLIGLSPNLASHNSMQVKQGSPSPFPAPPKVRLSQRGETFQALPGWMAILPNLFLRLSSSSDLSKILTRAPSMLATRNTLQREGAYCHCTQNTCRSPDPISRNETEQRRSICCLEYYLGFA